MVVALVTKGPILCAVDANLKVQMDPSPHHATDDIVIEDERRQKIAKLKQAVTDGTYSVSPEKLADKLIEHMLEPKA